MSAWVLLRGLTRETRHWGAFPALFETEVAGNNVVAIDLPGNGRLYRARSPARVDAMAEHARADLARRGLTPPFNVLAMSLGAMVATGWGTNHPGELAACVLINTSLRPFSPIHHRLRPGNYTRLLRLLLAVRDDREWEQTVLAMTSRRHAAPPGLIDDWVAWRREAPVSRANALRQLIAAARFRAPPTAPAPRTLLLTSTRDGLVDTRCSQRLSQAWHCELRTHPSAGHDLPLDDPAWVARQVREWLATGLRG